jgi:hypothetical protein
LIQTTTGSNNVAVGQTALFSNTTASNNTAVGYQAGYSTTTAGFNVFIGRIAGYTNTTGGGNTFMGNASGYYNTTGSESVAIGSDSLQSNTTGSFNTALGRSALFSNTTAGNNTAVGFQAGYSGTTGSTNSYFGYQAGYNITTGVINTFLGYNAGSAITTGSKNTILGSYNGNQGGLDIRTANNQIVLSDGDGNVRGNFDSSGNFCLGVTSTTSGARLAIRGNGTTGATYNIYSTNSASNVVFATEDGGTIYTGTLGGSPYNNTTGSAANMFVTAGGVLQRSTSSLKYKKNVQDATHGLADVLKLRAVTYEGKSESDVGKTFGGLIAEEVHAAGLTEFVQYAEDGSPDALAYGHMVSLLAKAIQEQQAIIVSLKARLDAANL